MKDTTIPSIYNLNSGNKFENGMKNEPNLNNYKNEPTSESSFDFEGFMGTDS